MTHSGLPARVDKKFDWSILFSLVAFGAVNLLISVKLFTMTLAVALVCLVPLDRFTFYKSSIRLLLPFCLLVSIGLLAGIQHDRHDYYRDVFIFSRNIIYFIAGIALSRYIKNFGQFFRYFLLLAFLASVVHIAKIARHLGDITSLQTIRIVGGFSNSVEGSIVSVALSCLLSRKFKEVIGKLRLPQKLMLYVTTLSFFLYFSRTLLILLPVICLFLTDTVYLRKIFSRKNRRLFRTAVFSFIVLATVYFSSLLLPQGSPVRTLIQKFENIPDEISWSKEKNLDASREEIRNNWRGYEAYQGMLKFHDAGSLQQAFGYGFGERVDLGLIMKLGGKDYEDVPILHNEYVMLLVKTGIIGLILYVFFLYRLAFGKLKPTEITKPELYYSYQMISALSIVMLLNTYTGFGLLDPANHAIPIFIGFFWGNIQRNTR